MDRRGGNAGEHPRHRRGPERIGFRITPNPGVDAALVFEEPLAGAAELRVFDLTGRICHREAIAPGSRSLRLPADLPFGPLVLRIVSEYSSQAAHWLHVGAPVPTVSILHFVYFRGRLRPDRQSNRFMHLFRLTLPVLAGLLLTTTLSARPSRVW